MDDSRPSTTDGEQKAEEQLKSLQARLQTAQAGERRAQALLESVASLMGVSDPNAVMLGIAENAVRHIGVPQARIYRMDHDAGVLIETARVRLNACDAEMPLPGMASVRNLDVDDQPIEIRPGNYLAEFALGDRAELVRETGEGGETLFQMRTAGRSAAEGRGALAGILVTSWAQPPTPREAALLRSLAAMGAAGAEAARIEEFRTQLVSTVSHELRTPLAAIRAYNELLLDEDAGEINEEQRLFLQRIETTCMLLDHMVEDLLDLSRLRAGEMVIRRYPVDVVGVIEHIIDTLSPEAAKRNISLTEEILGELPPISSNADRLAQVLFNLVGNAVKYGHEGGSVVVRASLCDGQAAVEACSHAESRGLGGSPEDECLLIEVIDDGPGIAHDELDRVFDEFYRGRLTERTTKGTGLGLAIASRLTRLLGGVLDVDSTPGQGCTFWLMFPVEPVESE